jgi:hypothetical protein
MVNVNVSRFYRQTRPDWPGTVSVRSDWLFNGRATTDQLHGLEDSR